MNEAEREAAEAGVEFLDELFERMDLDVEVEAGQPAEDAVVIQLAGDLTELKRRPELVSAISQLASQAISSATGQRARCVLELEGGGGYESRKSLLEVVAKDVADAVVRTRRRAVLEGLSSDERRVVHTVLVDDKRVRTRSEGDAEHRILLVEPA